MMQLDKISKLPGAYVLLVELKTSYQSEIGSLGNIKFSAGHYFYFGSARGHGGMQARVQRHIRAKKQLHWHVDWLLLSGTVIKVLLVAGGVECNLRQKADLIDDLKVIAPGFGSSDCDQCQAHLLAVNGGGSDTLKKLQGVTGGGIYSATSFFPITAAHPAIV
tara:strand:- start:1015 stop:1503 length:489 start_codon:yes stop_codon:yes gene_type:complete